jgi:MFS family permease
MLLLGAGWFGFQVFWAFHAGPLPLFLRDFTESKFTISIVLSLAGLMGCVLPPVVGYLSDHSVTRFGRRKPYVFCGFLGLSLCVLSLPHLATFWLVALVAGSMYFCLRFAETPYLSLLPDITPPEQRSTASGVMNLLGSVGLISCFAVSSAIWDDHPGAVFNLVAIASLAGVLLALSLIPEPEAAGQEAAETPNPLAYLRSVAEETNALKFFAAQFLWWLGFWMVSSFITLFVVEELGVMEGRSFLVSMAFSVVATLFVLPLSMLGDRFGRKGILSLAVLGWAAIQVVVGFTQDFTQALVAVGSSAIPFAAVMGVGLAFMLDLVPPERTAEFVGFSTISIAFAQIVGPLIGGELIDTLGYRSMFPTAAACMLGGLLLLQLVRPRREADT